MNKNRTNMILKKAIIMEQQGRIFYENIAINTDSEGLQKIFRTMAAEEIIHEKTLRSLLETGKETLLPETLSEFADSVLADDIIAEICGASYEAAAISAAMALEIRTVDFYKAGAETAASEDEKKLFNELSDWEGTHLQVLSNLNRTILERALRDEIY